MKKIVICIFLLSLTILSAGCNIKNPTTNSSNNNTANAINNDAEDYFITK